MEPTARDLEVFAQANGIPFPRRVKPWPEYDEVVEWVVRYVAQVHGARPSQRGYNDWARQQEGAPWSQAFNRYGGWSAVRRAAQHRVAKTSSHTNSSGP